MQNLRFELLKALFYSSHRMVRQRGGDGLDYRI